MELSNQTKLSFKGVEILNVNFSINKPFKGGQEIDISCSPFAIIPKSNKGVFNIVMDVEIASKDYFQLSLRAIGIFKLDNEITEELKTKFVNINSVAIMFPYVRSFVTTFSANVGNIAGGLTMPPQFFKGELDIIED